MKKFITATTWLGMGFLLLLAPRGRGDESFLPPMQPWTAASEALIATGDDPWITPSERSGLTETAAVGDGSTSAVRIMTSATCSTR
jgi:hypothetical protein